MDSNQVSCCYTLLTRDINTYPQSIDSVLKSYCDSIEPPLVSTKKCSEVIITPLPQPPKKYRYKYRLKKFAVIPKVIKGGGVLMTSKEALFYVKNNYGCHSPFNAIFKPTFLFRSRLEIHILQEIELSSLIYGFICHPLLLHPTPHGVCIRWLLISLCAHVK